ncbi:MAG: ATP-binding protein [Pseudomonadota bacterium]
MTRAVTNSPSLRCEVSLLVCAVVLLLGTALSFLPRFERLYQERAGAQGQATLRLAVDGLNGALRRFKPLPALIGQKPALEDFLRDPGNAALEQTVNEDLTATAEMIGASDVYLMDRTGLTLAASSYQKELSFVGRRFAFRPYFTEALAGGTGRYFALGTTSGERGYFYAAPVRPSSAAAATSETDVLGVIAVKFTVDQFEEAWRGNSQDIIVTDRFGVIFMSNRTEWHFQTLRPLSPSTIDLIGETKQYPLDRLTPLDVSIETNPNGLEIVSIRTGSERHDYISNASALPDAGWQARTLVPLAPARTQALVTVGALVMAILIAGLIGAVLVLRRARMRDHLRSRAAAQAELEERVRARTADLNQANAQLRTEIIERTTAEQQLRKTQTELVQAGKLAALGQMSAALSHEMNQPLAAVKSYADNAATFLDRDRTAEARDNVRRISDMADRMATIAAHLRNFARRPQDGVGPIEAVSVIDEAAAILDARLRQTGATVEFQRPDTPIWVRGGRLRLQQVIVNLLGNALDAMDDQDAPKVLVAIERPGKDRVEIIVRDSGPGLPQDVLEQAFDPFFTTKPTGQGLGLGLSISYNIVEDFGGRLRARNRPAGGAEFAVELIASDPPSATQAAE